MASPRVHPMMALSNHDELAEQQFVVALKSWLFAELEPPMRALSMSTAQKMAAQDGDAAPEANARRRLRELRPALERHELYQYWVSAQRAAQELMWQTAGDCVDRQRAELDELARTAPSLGSLRTDPGFQVPRYLAATDTHMMPGSYHVDPADGGVRQGAVFDKAASLYSMGRQGGQMNDMRGDTVVAHIFERFPQIQPQRILELGCTIGNSLVAVSRAFPEAEVHGIDVGASLLRYAHARAARLGVALHLAQANAECTDFPDASFDLVFTSAMLHETSARALPRIIAECWRVLRPGGVMVHLEVPFRGEEADAHDLVRADYESRFNNEPFWFGAVSAELDEMSRRAGFVDVAAGFQDAAFGPPRRGAAPGFGTANKGGYKSWYLVSGRKPAG